jgi:polysaccharide export outer membrane protein
MENHSVSVAGAVKKPGVFQIRGVRTVLEMLSMAEGLAEDAGDTVLILRSQPVAGAANESALETSVSGIEEVKKEEEKNGRTVEINLKRLLESGDRQLNANVYAGDVIKVTRAGVVYVVGAVNKAGGFLMKNNESITVLQVIALGEGLSRYAKKNAARIIRTNAESGQRQEIAIDVGRILDGKAEDRALQARDILFVPDSGGKRAVYRTSEAVLSIATGVIIWR